MHPVELTPRIVRFSKLPLLLGVSVFVGVVVLLIFTAAGKQQRQREMQEIQQAQAQLGALSPRAGKYWFEEQGKQQTEAVASPFSETKPALAASDTEQAVFELDAQKEKRRVELERVRLHERRNVTAEQAYQEALTAPLRVPLHRRERGAQQEPVKSGGIFQGLLQGFKEAPGENTLMRAREPARSAYELKAGSVIPAILLTGINSDLPGSVIAQVRENVYDTATGNHLLIPQGARLIGEYDSRINFGQSRALVMWTRLLYPDGSSLTLERMQGTDQAGYAGFKDSVDNHYGRIYGNALLLSLVGAGYNLLSGAPDNSNPNIADALAISAGQQLAHTTGDLTRQNTRLAPTITIRPGYAFNVMVMKDLVARE